MCSSSAHHPVIGGIWSFLHDLVNAKARLYEAYSEDCLGCVRPDKYVVKVSLKFWPPVLLKADFSMRTSLLTTACLFATSSAFRAPEVHSKAGIFHGRHLPTFDQDVFLGIKYAPKPERFTPAKLSEDAPNKHFNATKYGVDCMAYGSDTTALVSAGWTTLGEDCLHLNIIKPQVKEHNNSLPVLLWIYGGGWQQGATSDPR